jgi:hypothetical protein
MVENVLFGIFLLAHLFALALVLLASLLILVRGVEYLRIRSLLWIIAVIVILALVVITTARPDLTFILFTFLLVSPSFTLVVTGVSTTYFLRRTVINPAGRYISLALGLASVLSFCIALTVIIMNKSLYIDIRRY